MSRIVAMLLLMAWAAACAMPAEPAGAGAPPSDSIQVLKALERETGPRWRAKDIGFFERLFAEGFVWISTTEPQVQARALYLADLKKDYGIEATEIDEPTVILQGTTAAVYGLARTRGKADGVPFDLEFLYHDTFAWDGSAWKVLATSTVPVQKVAQAPAPAPVRAAPVRAPVAKSPSRTVVAPAPVPAPELVEVPPEPAEPVMIAPMVVKTPSYSRVATGPSAPPTAPMVP